MFLVVGLPSSPTSVHDHCAQSVGHAGNAISHSEKSSGISQGGEQNKVTNPVTYPSAGVPADISHAFGCRAKYSKVSAPWVVFPYPLHDLLSHFRDSSPTFSSISSLS